MDKELDFGRIYRQAARRISTAANIASGHGEYRLANDLWAFEARLKKRAREENERAGQRDTGEQAQA